MLIHRVPIKQSHWTRCNCGIEINFNSICPSGSTLVHLMHVHLRSLQIVNGMKRAWNTYSFSFFCHFFLLPFERAILYQHPWYGSFLTPRMIEDPKSCIIVAENTRYKSIFDRELEVRKRSKKWVCCSCCCCCSSSLTFVNLWRS